MSRGTPSANRADSYAANNSPASYPPNIWPCSQPSCPSRLGHVIRHGEKTPRHASDWHISAIGSKVLGEAIVPPIWIDRRRSQFTRGLSEKRQKDCGTSIRQALTQPLVMAA